MISIFEHCKCFVLKPLSRKTIKRQKRTHEQTLYLNSHKVKNHIIGHSTGNNWRFLLWSGVMHKPHMNEKGVFIGELLSAEHTTTPLYINRFMMCYQRKHAVYELSWTRNTKKKHKRWKKSAQKNIYLCSFSLVPTWPTHFAKERCLSAKLSWTDNGASYCRLVRLWIMSRKTKPLVADKIPSAT